MVAAFQRVGGFVYLAEVVTGYGVLVTGDIGITGYGVLVTGYAWVD